MYRVEEDSWYHFRLPFGFTKIQHEQNVMSYTLQGMAPSNYSNSQDKLITSPDFSSVSLTTELIF